MDWRFWRRAAAEQHAVKVRVVEVFGEARELPNPRDFKKLGEEGYRKNTLIKACIDEITQSLTQADLIAERVRNDGETEELELAHPLTRLLLKPNPEQSQRMFLRKLQTQLETAGNAYIHKVRRAQVVTELRTIRPDIVEIRVSRNGDILGFTLKRANGIKVPLAARDVAHILYADPVDDFYGTSPLESILKVGDLDTEAVDYLRRFFTNNATPKASSR